MTPAILVLNAGSSSVKFSPFSADGEVLHRLSRGKFEALGTVPRLSVVDEAGTAIADRRLNNTEAVTQEQAIRHLLGYENSQPNDRTSAARLLQSGIDACGVIADA